MRKLILEEWMSLDGYVSDKNGQLDFFTNISPEENTYSDSDQLKFLERIDTILLGRKTYELFVEFWPTESSSKEVIADKLNQTQKIVFSKTISKAHWGKWDNATVNNGDLISEVKKLKSKEGKDIVLWGSISIAQQLMKENLIDEYHIQLSPIFTGGGRRLFEYETDYQKLKLSELRQYPSNVIFLNYKKFETDMIHKTIE